VQNFDQTPSIDIVKSASPQTYSAVNGEITYSFLVTNTGNVTLTNVGVSDPLPGLGSITPAPVTLAPGESQVFEASYFITQADLDAGSVMNTATASGTPPVGEPVTAMDSETITADHEPSIDIVKSASPQTYSAVNGEITYSFLVTNTGNVTLTNVGVSDPLPGLGSITPAPVTLAPGESQVFEASYFITQADLDAGSVMNTATASGTPPVGEPVTAMDSEITYSFLVTNTGNVTLTNVGVSDPLPGLGSIMHR
jgi:uncharacterized repeat protein (TIGR01451 family)